jgi:DNA-binding LacI/PurR family transcriptional regulator
VSSKNQSGWLVTSTFGLSGKAVPEDVSIFGYQDVEYASMLCIPMTTVRYPAKEIGRIVVSTMLQMLHWDPEEPRIYLMGEKLMVRASCAPPRED